jgi:cysteine desulfurase/selenocysteine lyase
MCGPTGIGVLWGRKDLLKKMDPFHFGGDMISQVHLREASWNDLPYKFEAGTPNIADAIATGVAAEYLGGIGMQEIHEYEGELIRYAWDRLTDLPFIRVYGPPPPRGGLISFAVKGVHPHDVSQVLDAEGIAIRAGHHCAQPLMETLKVPALNRASFYFYNTVDDVDALTAALIKTKEFFGDGLE